MLAKKQVWLIKFCLVVIMLAAIVILPQSVSSFWRGMLFITYFFLLTILNYYAEHNTGFLKKRRDNLLFELVLNGVLFLVLCYVT